MKVRKIKVRRIIAVFLTVTLLALFGLLVIRDDYRFEISQFFKNITSENKLEEINEENLTFETIDAENFSDNSIIKNQSLILVNQNNIIADNFQPDICEYKNSGVFMNTCAVNSFGKMSDDMFNRFGEKLFVMSSFRTAEEQQEILNEQGSDTAMPAGSSEHQTGLGLDLYFDNFSGKAILKCEAGRYLNEHCSDYGFILRYPAGKKAVTKIDYEPWHFRYVGQPHAKIISESGYTLEDYIKHLEPGKFYSYEDYIISRQNGNNINVPAGKGKVISPDNCGGYIITVKVK